MKKSLIVLVSGGRASELVGVSLSTREFEPSDVAGLDEFNKHGKTSLINWEKE
jgi:hypothetical protein